MTAVHFPAAPLDQTARAVTSFTAGVLLVVPAVIAVTVPVPWAVAAVVAMGLVVLGLTWALAPTGYTVDGSSLQVRRRAWRSFSATIEGLSTHAEPERLGIRTAASGGAFGWYGRFRRRDLGSLFAYATSRDATQVTALRTDRGIVVLSPAEPRTFVAAVRKAVR